MENSGQVLFKNNLDLIKIENSGSKIGQKSDFISTRKSALFVPFFRKIVATVKILRDESKGYGAKWIGRPTQGTTKVSWP